MAKISAPLTILVLLGVLAIPDVAMSLNGKGTGNITVKLAQLPALTSQPSRYLGTNPAKCLLGIPFEGLMSSGVAQAVNYWFVHSDGTKSAVLEMQPPTEAGRKFSYNWSKYVAPNQPFSGWVRAEASWSGYPGTYKSANVPFTVTCIPNKPATWPTAPIIVTPTEGQKVAGGAMVIQPMNPGLSKCADGGFFTVKMEHRAAPNAAWAGGSLQKPLPCGPQGAQKNLDGLQPGYYRVMAKEGNKNGFQGAWSAWRSFEVAK